MCQAGERGKKINRWIAALFTNHAIQYDVTIKRTTDCICDGIIVVVPVDEHRIDTGNRTLTLCAGSRPLQKLWQVAEHRRWVPARHRGFSCRKCHLTAGMCITGHRIHHEQHILAEIAEMFGQRSRKLRGKAAHHRTFVTRRHDGDGISSSCTQRILDKFPYLPATFTDQRDDDAIEGCRARNHAEKRRLADTRTSEDAHPLAQAQWREAVEHAHAGGHAL